MRIILDTHAFLWHLTGAPRLPAAILDPANEVHLSVASVREAVVKYYSGKLPLPGMPELSLPEQRDIHGIASPPIDEGAMPHPARLPLLRRDPFHRVLITQALHHGLTMATVDPIVMA